MTIGFSSKPDLDAARSLVGTYENGPEGAVLIITEAHADTGVLKGGLRYGQTTIPVSGCYRPPSSGATKTMIFLSTMGDARAHEAWVMAANSPYFGLTGMGGRTVADFSLKNLSGSFTRKL